MRAAVSLSANYAEDFSQPIHKAQQRNNWRYSFSRRSLADHLELGLICLVGCLQRNMKQLVHLQQRVMTGSRRRGTFRFRLQSKSNVFSLEKPLLGAVLCYTAVPEEKRVDFTSLIAAT